MVLHATYISNQEGNVDLTESKAILGTYKGVDPAGLFWSMEIVPDQAALPEYLTPLKMKNLIRYFFILMLKLME